MTGQILTDATDVDLVEAIEGNMLSRYLMYRSCPEVEVHDDPEVLWTISHLPYATFNTVHRARLTHENSDRVIAQVMRRGQLNGVPLLWWVGPLSRPADLGSRLLALGWLQGEVQPGMAVELELLPTAPGMEDFHFARATTLAELITWWNLACEINDRPRGIVADGARCYASMSLEAGSTMRCYLGRLRGEPVSTACLVLGAGVVGLYGIGTLPAARRRGIGTAMTLAALHEARVLGYRYGVLRASTEGAPLYRRLGFREYGRFGTYLWDGPRTEMR